MNKWYGNVRQLESCIEYAVIVCNGPFIEIKDLPDDFHQVPDERNREKYEVPTIQNIYSSVDEELTSMSITEKVHYGIILNKWNGNKYVRRCEKQMEIKQKQ